MPMGRPPRPPLERFERQSQLVDSGCIEWTGRIDRYGYGQFRPGGRETTQMGAHRWAYEHHVGKIPKGLQIDHLCRNRKCVNPAHMEAVTPQVNALRSTSPAARNAQKTHCKNGHLLAGENIYPNKRYRICKICNHAAGARNYRARVERAKKGA